MIPYASNTRTKRNLAALKSAQWRILLTPTNGKPPSGFRYPIDNDAWHAFQTGSAFDADAFAHLVECHGARADFVVVPDIVASRDSLDFSLSWLSRLRSLKQLLLPVQDGMTPKQIGRILKQHPNLGIFLGGSTEWKLRTMYTWGEVAAVHGRWYHVARVNTARRIRLAAEAGATSIDGTSATRYSCTLPLLDSARRQPNLLNPNLLTPRNPARVYTFVAPAFA